MYIVRSRYLPVLLFVFWCINGDGVDDNDKYNDPTCNDDNSMDLAARRAEILAKVLIQIACLEFFNRKCSIAPD